MRIDLLTVLESRLFDQHIRKHMVPTESPAPGKDVGSRFGWRIDPLTGQSALHAGLDFSADTGAPIVAAAGGNFTESPPTTRAGKLPQGRPQAD